MSMFGSIRVSASGMDVYQTWIDAISDNVANVNTITSTDEAAFQKKLVVAEAVGGAGNGIGTGSRVSGIRLGDEEGRLIYDPEHPLADDEGMVRAPDMDLETQMTHLIVAQRSYQANVTVFERARDSYQRALEIGR
ncbi:MAG: flagellar basal body rod protein FlgC [Actinomycetota bacterium]